MIQDPHLYVILLSKIPGKTFTEAVILEHVEHIKTIHRQGRLVLCGPFIDHPGGMIVLRADSLEDAKHIAEMDPFVKQGFETQKVRTLQRGGEDNNWLLDE